VVGLVVYERDETTTSRGLDEIRERAHVNVYGGPPPDPSLGLNYLGWAPPTVLLQYQLGLITLQYQLGLITCSLDELRRGGFSAKHLQYIALGLPVLVPSGDVTCISCVGPSYNEDTFLSVFEAFSDEDAWERVIDEAYSQGQRLTWDQTLSPLEALLRR
jgi:hypothetical protein